MNDEPGNVADFDKYRLYKLLGEAAKSEAESDPEALAKMKMILDRYIKDPQDRALLRAEGLL